MLKVGLTGGIGSGKTLICKVFSELSVPVYHADIEARRLMETDQMLKNKIIEEFGSSVYSNDKLQTKTLGDIVFNDVSKLQHLNSIVHPVVHVDFDRWSAIQKNAAYVIEEAAILFESGGAEKMDYIIFVHAELETRIRRVMLRDSIDRSTVLLRVKNQMEDIEKEKMADFVIYNENDSMILPQIVDLHKNLKILNN